MKNYRNERNKYKPNELGSLYVNKDLDSNERPIIYIGGQMEHRCHILEQSGKTFDVGHKMFNGSWFYDYPITRGNKNDYNGENFANNLIESLKMANLSDVDLVTESFGGIVGSYASKSDRIHKIYAVHPPIIGTPLANPEELLKRKELFLKNEKLLLLLMKKIVNTKYGFESDNYKGIDPSKVDLNKLLVIGSTLDLETETDELSKTLYDLILRYTQLKSDGIVTYDEDIFNKIGINYKRESQGLTHFKAGSEEHLAEVKEYVKSK